MVYFLLFFLFGNNNSDKYLISKIKITGNVDTKEYVIRREVLFNEGDTVSKDEIEKNLKRIENLGIFNSVLYNLNRDTDSTSYVLTYTVIEKLNLIILPQVILYTDRGNKVSYGLKVKHTNLFGRNLTLNTDLIFAYRSGFRVYFQNPWAGGKSRFFYSLSFSQLKVNNSMDDDVLNKTTNMTFRFGKKFGPFIAVSSAATYQNIEFAEQEKSRLSYSASLNDKMMKYSISLDYDTRDFYRNPKSGFRGAFSINYLDYLQGKRASNYGFITELRHYFTYSSLTFVNGLFNGNFYNDMVYYEQFAFGDNSVIRAHNHRREFGNNLFIYRNEIRYDILKDFRLSIDLPYVKSYLQNMHISSYLFTFIDSGLLYDGLRDFSYNNFKSSYGLGLAFMTPYLPYFSFQYGMNAIGYSKFNFSMKLYL